MMVIAVDEFPDIFVGMLMDVKMDVNVIGFDIFCELLNSFIN